MDPSIQLHLNGALVTVQAPAQTPLLYVLRDECDQHGPRFGCGLGQCGACTVHLDGAALRSCVTPVAAAQGREVTTLDGLAAAWQRKHDAKAGDATALHPVQQAFIDEEAAQCGYCINGWIMTAAALLAQNPNLSDAQLRAGLSGLKCRCGTHLSVLRAIKRAATAMVGARATETST
jgi:nicotinate dehydrogenase subunit A